MGAARGMVIKAGLLLLFFSGLAACGGGAGDADTLRVSGSTTVNPVAADAAEALRKHGLEVTVDTQGGSAGASPSWRRDMSTWP